MTVHTFLKNVKSIISFIKDNGFDIFLNVIFAISIISVFFLIFLIISPLLASSFPVENGAVSDDQLLQKVIKGYISFFLSIQNALLTSNSSIHSEAEINYGLNGDAFGVINPFIAFLAAILTFIAFLTQYIANRKMLQDNRKQQAERQFYEMLRINQINVENIQIPQPWEVHSLPTLWHRWHNPYCRTSTAKRSAKSAFSVKCCVSHHSCPSH